tara:strand:- start:2339 stop:2887 length:549 start_codon:yes stop_codon:yes gene_type:complete
MIKLTIYGRLRKLVGQSTFEIKANSPREAFSFLINNFDGVNEHIKDQEYCVMAGDLRIWGDMLDLQTESDIKIIPVIHGEGLFKTLLGFGLAVFGGFIPVIGPWVQRYGISLMIDGIQDMLTPDPKPNNVQRQEDPQDPSFVFTGLLNNSKQGVPINIVYGETLIGSTVVSSSIDTFQVVNS